MALTAFITTGYGVLGDTWAFAMYVQSQKRKSRHEIKGKE